MRNGRNIILIGMPGCGKSAIGRLLSKKLNICFCDIDRFIEEKEGKTIPEIFISGEAAFRDIEERAVAEVVKTAPKVIATGGGVVLNQSNMDILRENGIIFFINRRVEDIISDVDISSRPLLKSGPGRIYDIYNERISLYKKYSDYEVLNTDSIENTVNKIISICEG